MTGLIDSHCHLTFDGLREQVGTVIEKASAVGVFEFIAPGTDVADTRLAMELAADYPSVHVAAGVHPHEASKVSDAWETELLELAADDCVVAVGETGLDYHYNFSDHDSQQRVFRRQLEIAQQVGKPVVIHSREAHPDVMRILSEFSSLPGVVFHCFSGTSAEADEILGRGYWLSWTGVVTFKRSDELRGIARRMPVERMMLETDSPFLSPVPVRKVQPNEPAHLVYTARCIAEARGMDFAEFAEITVESTRRFFSLSSG